MPIAQAVLKELDENRKRQLDLVQVVTDGGQPKITSGKGHSTYLLTPSGDNTFNYITPLFFFILVLSFFY